MLIKMLGLNLASFTQLHCPWLSIGYVLYFSVHGSTLNCNYNVIPVVLEPKGVKCRVIPTQVKEPLH